uniref:Uncharacterized protein n=1 Tax=Heterorhabditis bacteriophora TaxID=37862 RepID=A0A1I7X4P5_HETBA
MEDSLSQRAQSSTNMCCCSNQHDPGARLVTSNVPALNEFLLIPQKTTMKKSAEKHGSGKRALEFRSEIYCFNARHTKEMSFSGAIQFFLIFTGLSSTVPSNSATPPFSCLDDIY